MAMIFTLLWFGSGAVGVELFRRQLNSKYPRSPNTGWFDDLKLWHGIGFGPLLLLHCVMLPL